MTDATTVRPAVVCDGCIADRQLHRSGHHEPGADRVVERCAHVREFMRRHPTTHFEAVFLSEASADRYIVERRIKNLGVERAFGRTPRDLWVVVSW